MSLELHPDKINIDNKCSLSISIVIMKQFGRIFIVLLLTAFVVGTVANVASATAMTIAMSDTVDTEMVDCDGCNNEDESSFCDSTCVVPLSVLLNSDKPNQPSRLDTAYFAFVGDGDSYTGPPDPYPPRLIILK